MRKKLSQINYAFTLLETVIAMGILSITMSSVFDATARTMSLLLSVKQTNVATQTLVQRMEQIRASSFANLVTPSYLQNTLLGADTNVEYLLGNPTELLTITDFNTQLVTLQLQRQAGTTQWTTLTTSAQQNAAATTLSASNALLVTLNITWTAAQNKVITRECTVIIAQGGINQ